MTTPCDRPLKMRGIRTVGLYLENGSGSVLSGEGLSFLRADDACRLGKCPLDRGPREQSCHDGRRLFRLLGEALPMDGNEFVTAVKYSGRRYGDVSREGDVGRGGTSNGRDRKTGRQTVTRLQTACKYGCPFTLSGWYSSDA